MFVTGEKHKASRKRKIQNYVVKGMTDGRQLGVRSKSVNTKGVGKISSARLRDITHAPLEKRKESEPKDLNVDKCSLREHARGSTHCELVAELPVPKTAEVNIVEFIREQQLNFFG